MSDAPAHRLRTVYEDEWLLIVDKPAGLLSVPGRETDAPSVLSLMRSRLPQAEGPLVVHRLDMDTSGLMLIAKTADVHRSLQALFETRAVEKEYIALLEGTVTTDSGLIDLPLGPSPHHRPCQEVRAPHAKPAQTLYEVLERREGRTLVRFRPLTVPKASAAPSWATRSTARLPTASTCMPARCASSIRLQEKRWRQFQKFSVPLSKHNPLNDNI